MSKVVHLGARCMRKQEPSTASRVWRRRTFLGAAVLTGAAAAGGLAWRARGEPSPAPAAQMHATIAPTISAQTARGWVKVDIVAEGIARLRITGPGGEPPPPAPPHKLC